MVLNKDRKDRARTLSEDDCLNHIAPKASWEEVCDVSSKVLQAESGCQEGLVLPGAENKKPHLILYPVYTINSFCLAHKISKAQLYVLFRRGEGPKTYTVGRRRYISLRSAAAWIDHNEALTAAQSRGADR